MLDCSFKSKVSLFYMGLNTVEVFLSPESRSSSSPGSSLMINRTNQLSQYLDF